MVKWGPWRYLAGRRMFVVFKMSSQWEVVIRMYRNSGGYDGGFVMEIRWFWTWCGWRRESVLSRTRCLRIVKCIHSLLWWYSLSCLFTFCLEMSRCSLDGSKCQDRVMALVLKQYRTFTQASTTRKIHEFSRSLRRHRQTLTLRPANNSQ